MKAILVTGATGFLGKSIVKELQQQQQHKIFSLSRTKGDYKVFLESKIPVFNENFDLVIHAAGKAHSVPKSEVEKKNFNEVNVIGTQNLLKGLEQLTMPKQFVFISSVSVYGLEFGENINEECALRASDAYGLSKIEAEALVTNWCKQNNVICTILRLPLLVGKNAPGNLGAMVKAIENGYYFNIGGGTAKKSMVLIQDVASVIIKAESTGGIYNLSDGVHPSFYELSLEISRSRNKKKPMNLSFYLAKLLAKVGDLLGDKSPINSLKIKKITSNLTFDDSKAREKLNWNPQSVVDYIANNRI